MKEHYKQIHDKLTAFANAILTAKPHFKGSRFSSPKFLMYEDSVTIRWSEYCQGDIDEYDYEVTLDELEGDPQEYVENLLREEIEDVKQAEAKRKQDRIDAATFAVKQAKLDYKRLTGEDAP